MKIYKVLLVAAAILLFLATLDVLTLPFESFFTFLRFMIFSIAIYAALQERNSIFSLLSLLLVVVLFNPLVPIRLSEICWHIIDLATAATFIRLAIKPLKTKNQQ